MKPPLAEKKHEDKGTSTALTHTQFRERRWPGKEVRNVAERARQLPQCLLGHHVLRGDLLQELTCRLENVSCHGHSYTPRYTVVGHAEIGTNPVSDEASRTFLPRKLKSKAYC